MGWIGIACILFGWILVLAPNSVAVIAPILEKIGPLSWLILIAMVALPVYAAKRESKWWWAVVALGAITIINLLLHALQ